MTRAGWGLSLVLSAALSADRSAAPGWGVHDARRGKDELCIPGAAGRDAPTVETPSPRTLLAVAAADPPPEPAGQGRLPQSAWPDPVPGFTGSAHDFLGPLAPLEARCAPCHAAPPTAPATTAEGSPFTPVPDRGRSAPRSRRLLPVRARRTPADSTALCLSCHDGALGSEIIGGGNDGALFPAGTKVDLPRDHPVGVPYPPSGRTAEAVRRQYVPASRLEAEGLIRLPGGRVECISCHDPHNALGIPAMLVKPDRRSALCLSCHVK